MLVDFHGCLPVILMRVRCAICIGVVCLFFGPFTYASDAVSTQSALKSAQASYLALDFEKALNLLDGEISALGEVGATDGNARDAKLLRELFVERSKNLFALERYPEARQSLDKALSLGFKPNLTSYAPEFRAFIQTTMNERDSAGDVAVDSVATAAGSAGEIDNTVTTPQRNPTPPDLREENHNAAFVPPPGVDEPEPGNPKAKRRWLWPVVGTVAAVVVGGAILGVTMANRSPDGTDIVITAP